MKPVILIDCDMVLLDFNQRVADIYEELFGEQPPVKNPGVFKAAQKYDFSHLNKEQLDVFVQSTQGENMWQKMKPMEGALDFAYKLAEHYTLVVLTSMENTYEDIRHANLLELGFPIAKTIAVSRIGDENPKEVIAKEYGAVYFIDDLAKNFKGLDDIATTKIFLDWEYTCGTNKDAANYPVNVVAKSFDDILTHIENSMDIRNDTASYGM